ncbi:unnamed protein product, partial [Laminaria digitata]
QSVDANVGRCPWQVLLCGFGVEDTPKWAGASSLYGTERGTSGSLELVCMCNEAVHPRGRGPGIRTIARSRSRNRMFACSQSHACHLWLIAKESIILEPFADCFVPRTSPAILQSSSQPYFDR